MECELASYMTKCQMYERMLDMKEEEIKRLYQIVLCAKPAGSVASTARNVCQLSEPFFSAIHNNISLLEDTEIRQCLTSPYPAIKSLVHLITKILNNSNTPGKLCRVVNQTFIEYVQDDLCIKKEDYTFLFDKIFIKIYDKCKSVGNDLHTEIHNEQQHIRSDNFYNNIMILHSNEKEKRRLQKDIFTIVKHDAFSN